MSSSEPVVLCEYRDSIALVTLNRPQQRNCFNPEVIVRLATLWKEINANPAVRVVIVTGTGDKAFCSGADLKRLIPLMTGAREPEDEWDFKLKEDPRAIARAILMDDTALDKPVIAVSAAFRLPPFYLQFSFICLHSPRL